ncbi:MAG TPA: RHS repeat-associated core domain-containing protein [Verrucomicrobiota bacterium]|nr:hypothetical protein [Verrucomicrobiales bacterium]HRI12167.1 RHS repeat-associated core domain-containing protein [Verrucomicrobiota bacterium]
MNLRSSNRQSLASPALAVLGAMVFCGVSLADCGPDPMGRECWVPNVTIEFSHASHAKPGWPEFCPARPPFVQHYLSYTIVSHSNAQLDEQNPNWPGESVSEAGFSKTWSQGYRELHLSSSYDATETTTIDRQTEAIKSHTFSGSMNGTTGDDDQRLYTHHTAGIGYYKRSSLRTFMTYSEQLTTSGFQGRWQGSRTDGCSGCGSYVTQDDWTHETGWFPTPQQTANTDYLISAIQRFGDRQVLCTPTTRKMDQTTPPPGGAASTEETISNLYSDADLEAKVRSDMAASGWGVGMRSAKRLWSATHEYLYLRRLLLTFSFATIAGQRYTLSWTEYTFSFQGGFRTEQKSWTLASAPGGEVTYQVIVEPPVENGVRFAGDFKVCQGWSSLSSAGRVSRAGSARGCCGGDADLGDGRVALEGGPLLTVNLGKTEFGAPAGVLTLAALTPHEGLAQSASLTAASLASSTELVVNSNGTIAQAKSSQRLVHVETVSGYQFKIHFFGPTLSAKGANGLYPTNGMLELTSWTVTAPDGAQGNFNRLRITEDKAGSLRTSEFVYSEVDRSWTLTRPEGLSVERRSSSWDPAFTQLTEVYQALDPISLAVVYHEEFRYQLFGDDAIGYPERDQWIWLVEHRVGTGANALVTTYEPDPNTGRRKVEIDPYGSWTVRNYDSMGFLSEVITGLKDSTHSDFVSNSTSAPVKKRVFEYSTVDAWNDDGGVLPRLARTETESQSEVTISQTKRVVHAEPISGAIEWLREYRMHAEDADQYEPLGLDDPANLVTETQFYTSGPSLGRIKSVKTPDGLMQIFTYADGAGLRTTSVDSGLADSNGAIIKGTRSVTVVNDAGQTVSSSTASITGLNTTLTTSSITFDNFDSRGRPQRTLDNLSGLAEWSSYSCCMLDSTTSREGTVTSYTYDSLNRLRTSTMGGVTTINNYDAAGRIQYIQRQGSDASVITLSGYAYDDAGRTLSETNAAGVVTSFVEDLSNGYLLRTTTEAVGTAEVVTRKERYFRDGQLAEMGGTAASPDTGSNPVRYDYGVFNEGDHDNPNYHPYRITINLTSAGTPTGTNEWVMTWSDFFGRPYKTIYSDSSPSDLANNPASESFYDSAGRVVRQVDPDGVTTLFLRQNYNEDFTVIDLDRDGIIDWNGPDRITKTLNETVAEFGTTTRRTTVSEYKLSGNSTASVISTTSSSVDGLRTWTVTPGVVNPAQTQVSFPGNGYRNVTSTAPDGSFSVAQYQHGRLLSQTQYSSSGSQVGKISYTYDAHGRQWKVTDARNGTTTYGYDTSDRVVSVTTPPPGTGLAAQTAMTVYDSLGRVQQLIQPDESVVKNEYFPTGSLKKTSGSRTYPLEYTYDAQGRMKTLKTWRQLADAATSATTTWNYNPYRGWLDNKRYADGKGPDFTYTKGGRMKTRQWARKNGSNQRLLTTWTYGFESATGPEDNPSKNDSGDLVALSYTYDPQNTPTVSYGYDRCGHPTTVTRGALTATRTYNTTGDLLSESWSGTGATLAGLSVIASYDGYLRRQVISAKNGTQTLASVTYGYDTAGRLATAGDGTYSATYGYLANSALPGTLTFKHLTTTRMTTTRSFDFLNRLYQVKSMPAGSGQSAMNFRYGYNDAGQRITLDMPDGSGWRYQYDNLGQLIVGRRFWSDGTPVAGQQFEYVFDDIGNRKITLAGGDNNGANLRQVTYTPKPNGLNQYDTRTVPPYWDVTGIALASVTPTINSTAPDARKGEYFWKALNLPNSTGPQWTAVNVTVPGGVAQTGNVLMPPATQTFTYDDDGNLLSDGLWSYTWDAENRLLAIQNVAAASLVTAARKKVTFEYDDRSRRIGKKTYAWGSNDYSTTPSSQSKFLLEGWNVLAELDSANAVTRSYIWGNDLSGTSEGAGGAGGLIAVKPGGTTAHFVAYDGNGNVTGLVDGSTGIPSATYEYGPFGEMIRATGAQAKANPIRFSTKYQDPETDLLYYGYRYYSPTFGRWINRDSMEELDSPALYGFVSNDPSGRTDTLGLWASQMGFFIHQSAIDSALSFVEDRFREIIKDRQGHDGIDAFQSGKLSFLHAMRNLNTQEAVATARAKSIRWVQVEIRAAWKLWRQCDKEEALVRFGNALHTIQDNTSPSHQYFQPWDDRWGNFDNKPFPPLAWNQHIRFEINDPGTGSLLHKATAGMWDHLTAEIEPKVSEMWFDLSYWDRWSGE